MATDWAADVKKYDPSADDGIIAGIVRYCGIALRKVDSSLVSFSDPKETDRVRQNFLKKKLGLTEPDSVLDAAIAAVGERMKADRTKNRVTVYYLLAQNFGLLGMFAPKAKASKAAGSDAGGTGGAVAAGAAGAAALGLMGAAGSSAAAANPAKKKAPAAKVTTAKATPVKKVAIPAAEPVPAPAPAPTAESPVSTAAAGLAAGAAGLAAAGAAAVGSAADATAPAAPVAAPATLAASTTAAPADSAPSRFGPNTDDDDSSGLGWLWWLLAALLLLGLIWFLFFRQPSGDAASADRTAATTETTTAAATADGAATAATDLTAAPAEGSVEIPTGAGVTSELRDGKPVVKVYFDTGASAVAPAFTAAAGGLKAYLDANPGTSLAVSGYNDSTGNAAANAELSKNRALAVRDALIASGIAEGAVEAVKPEDTTAGAGNDAAARRVEVVVR